jgi:hypothetical protein
MTYRPATRLSGTLVIAASRRLFHRVSRNAIEFVRECVVFMQLVVMERPRPINRSFESWHGYPR